MALAFGFVVSVYQTHAATLKAELDRDSILVGETFTLTLSSVQLSGPCAFTFGASDSQWSGGALPAPLTGIGLPNCLLRVSPDLLDVAPGYARNYLVPRGLAILDRDGICVRAGHHCAMPLHDLLGVPASARASFHCYSLREDVDALVDGLLRAQRFFAGGR